MDGLLPLPTLLSHALVAFTIELDNEFEQRMPHRTTRHRTGQETRAVPWLVSAAMWANCMQFIGEEGLTARELVRKARTKTNFRGMRRWGYIAIRRAPTDFEAAGASSEAGGAESAHAGAKARRAEWIVRRTPEGRKAQEIWRPLFGEIEKRWEKRFGENEIKRLRESLMAVERQIEVELPDCLPILKYGLLSGDAKYKRRAAERSEVSHSALFALLSRVLLAFAIDYERESDISLAIGANVLRVLDEKGVRLRDLPIVTGVSKEAISMALGFLRMKGLATVRAEQSGRSKVIRLTRGGRKAREAYRKLLGVIEERWGVRFGEKNLRRLRESLEELAADGNAPDSGLFRGLEPYPEGWRACVRKPNTLPHYPMVLHRGGFPDGS